MFSETQTNNRTPSCHHNRRVLGRFRRSDNDTVVGDRRDFGVAVAVERRAQYPSRLDQSESRPKQQHERHVAVQISVHRRRCTGFERTQEYRIFRLFMDFSFLQIAKKITTQREWDVNVPKILRSNKISSTDEVYGALNQIQTQLNTLMALEPLPNKLLSIPQVFMSSELSETTTNVLTEVSLLTRP